MNEEEAQRAVRAIGDVAKESQRSVKAAFASIPTGMMEELRKTREQLVAMPSYRLDVPTPRPTEIALPPNPAIRTNAEIRKLNSQVETLVGVTTTLVDATLQLHQSTRTSNRRMLVLTAMLVLLGALTVALAFR